MGYILQDKFKNSIYQLTNEEKELIVEHLKFYEELFKFGNGVLDSGFQDPIPDYKLTIYSMIYRILELLDTLKVMTEKSLINSGLIIARALLEVSVQLQYIIFDKDNIEKKAIILQMLDIKRTAQDLSVYYNTMFQYDCYRSYIEVITNNNYANWYSYCENKKTSLNQLFRLVDWDDIYENIYKPLCLESHELNHMETNIVFDDNKFNFKPFRTFENHILLLNTIITILCPLFDKLIPLYGDNNLKQEWMIYSKKLYDYIDGNNQISNISKAVNPLLKWF